MLPKHSHNVPSRCRLAGVDSSPSWYTRYFHTHAIMPANSCGKYEIKRRAACDNLRARVRFYHGNNVMCCRIKRFASIAIYHLVLSNVFVACKQKICTISKPKSKVFQFVYGRKKRRTTNNSTNAVFENVRSHI